MPHDPVLILVTAPTAAEALEGRGFAVVDPDAPHVRVTDQGLLRGDGVFETVGVFDGRPQALEAHLERLAHSARLLDLPEPRTGVWRAAVLEAVAAHAPAPEVAVRLVLSRGVEETGACSGWVHARAVAPLDDARRDGVAVVTLDRGYRSDVARTSPWLLQGAKYLSYAVNMAALRHAGRVGADDVIFVSTDGAVLEGPTATVLARYGDDVVTPADDQGILAGTTQARAFAYLARRGLRTHERRLEAAELAEADGIWLVSSVRLAVPVRMLDGVRRTWDAELTAGLVDHLRRVPD